jgi:predicted small lipoprotein YifL
MRVFFRMSAIVAALTVTVASSAALTGCGQIGPLYLPTVPPLPPKPIAQTEPPERPASGAEAASSPDVDSEANPEARAPLTLTPAGELGASAPRAKPPSPASGASKSSTAPNQ